MSAPPLDVRYVALAVSDPSAILAFALEHIEWDSRMRARRTASFGQPYDYSGHRYPWCPMPEPVARVERDAAAIAGHQFDNCLANLYAGGDNTMGLHCDSYAGLDDQSAIAIASFGATRTLVFESVDGARREAFALAHGSILLMTRATQLGWRHGVPREPGAEVRVSLTFRRTTRAGMGPPAEPSDADALRNP